jgi:hypothetical protein
MPSRPQPVYLSGLIAFAAAVSSIIAFIAGNVVLAVALLLVTGFGIVGFAGLYKRR